MPIRDEGPVWTADEAQGRVNETGAALAVVVNDITDRIGRRIWEQEKLLKTVYQPLKDHVNRRVRATQELLAPVIDVIRGDVNGHVANNMVRLNGVTPYPPPADPGGVDAVEPPPPPKCPPGTFGVWPDCVPVPCPPGFKPDPNDPSGQCIPDEGPPPPPPPPPPGKGPPPTCDPNADVECPPLGCGPVKELPTDCNGCIPLDLLERLLDDDSELHGPPGPGGGGQPGTFQCPDRSILYEVQPGQWVGCLYDPISWQRTADSDPRCPATHPYLDRFPDCPRPGGGAGGGKQVMGTPPADATGTNPAAPSHDWSIFVGAVPKHILGRKAAAAGPLRQLLLRLPALVPPGVTPRVFESDGPPPPRGSKECPPDDGAKLCKKEEPEEEPECDEDIIPDADGIEFHTEELCLTIDEMTARFADFGRRISDLAVKAIQTTVDALDAVAILESAPIIGPFIRNYVKWTKPAADMLEEIGCIIKAVNSARFSANADMLVGLWFAKGIVNMFRGGTFGWELGPQLLFALQIELKQLNQICDYLIDYAMPINLPSQENADGMFLANEIKDSQHECLTKLNGNQWDIQQRVVRSNRTRPSDDVLVRDYLRFRTPPRELIDRLRINGWLDEEEIARFVRSYEFIPPPSDAIRFAIKDVYDVNKLGKQEMLDELQDNPALLDLLAATGITTIQIRNSDGQITTHDIPGNYWLSSFEEISPTQAYEMQRRLRPGRTHLYRQTIRPTQGQVKRGSVAGATVVSKNPDGTWTIEPQPFTSTDLQKLLKEVDYNPIWRSRLEAISFEQPTLVDMAGMYRTGALGPPQGEQGFDTTEPGDPKPTGFAEKSMAEMFQDRGLSDLQARQVAFYRAKTLYDKIQQPIRDNIKKLVCRGYQAGVWTEDEAKNELAAVTPDEKEQESILYRCNYERKIKILEAGVKAVRSIYLRWEADENEAGQMLSELGVVSERVAEYVQLWFVERKAKSKKVAAAKLCAFRDSGIISNDEYVSTLMRMGYKDKDTARMLLHCQLGKLARDRKEQEKLLRAELAADARRRAGETEPNIRTWLKRRFISSEQAADMLRDKGWLEADVIRWVTANLP